MAGALLLLQPAQAALDHGLPFPAPGAFDIGREGMPQLRLTHVAADWAAGQGKHGDGVYGDLAGVG